MKIIFKSLEIASERDLRLQSLKATMNLTLCSRALSCSVIFRSIFLQYLKLILIISSFDFCVCEYVVDMEFLFLFGESSANSYEIAIFNK